MFSGAYRDAEGHVVSRRVIASVLGIFACFALSACATDGLSFSRQKEDVARQTLPPPVYQADDPVSVTPVSPVDVPDLVDQMSRGGVTVYGLDEPPGQSVYDDVPGRKKPSAAPLMLRPPVSAGKFSSGTQAPAPLFSGVPSAADSSVLIFPLDGSSFSLVGTSDGPPARVDPESLAPEIPDRTVEKVSLADVDPPSLDAPLRIYFDHNSARLGSGAKKALSDVARNVKTAGGAASVLVEGHASARAVLTDPARKESTNLKKSLDRAYAVSDTLIRQGVPAGAIVTAGYGDSRPVAEPPPGRSAESANRRVDVRLTQ